LFSKEQTHFHIKGGYDTTVHLRQDKAGSDCFISGCDVHLHFDVGEKVLLTAPDGTPVTIARDDYGVPHITAETETGVFFGQEFAAGGGSCSGVFCQLEPQAGQLVESWRQCALGGITSCDGR